MKIGKTSKFIKIDLYMSIPTYRAYFSVMVSFLFMQATNKGHLVGQGISLIDHVELSQAVEIMAFCLIDDNFETHFGYDLFLDLFNQLRCWVSFQL